MDQAFLALYSLLDAVDVRIHCVRLDGTLSHVSLIKTKAAAPTGKTVDLALILELHYCAVVPRHQLTTTPFLGRALRAGSMPDRIVQDRETDRRSSQPKAS